MKHREKIIAVLETVRERPAMYLGTVEPKILEVFFSGIALALTAFDLPQPTLEGRVNAYRTRGWKFNALGGIPAMKSRGLSKEAIVCEILECEIAAWRALRDDV